MRQGGAGNRRDKTEPDIIKALRAAGAVVFQLSGAGVPDLLVGFRRRWFAIEVKSPGGTATVRQGWPDVPVVRTPEEALTAIGLAIVPNVDPAHTGNSVGEGVDAKTMPPGHGGTTGQPFPKG